MEEILCQIMALCEQGLGTAGTVEVAETATALPVPTEDDRQIAYGAKVSPLFKSRVLWIADTLETDASYLMACMAWESGGTFSSNVLNRAGSGAVGLIQFMPSIAVSLGTTTKALTAMTPEDQLNYVYKYFRPMGGRLKNLGDVYMTILWPGAVGKTDDYVLFDRSVRPTAYRQNGGLDINKNGLVTRGECLVKINQRLTDGLLSKNCG